MPMIYYLYYWVIDHAMLKPSLSNHLAMDDMVWDKKKLNWYKRKIYDGVKIYVMQKVFIDSYHRAEIWSANNDIARLSLICIYVDYFGKVQFIAAYFINGYLLLRKVCILTCDQLAQFRSAGKWKKTLGWLWSKSYMSCISEHVLLNCI